MEFLHFVLTGNCLSLHTFCFPVFSVFYFDMVLKFCDSVKAMIIVAWNGSGNPNSIFSGDVFKKVLSVFITAAILKLGQGR